MPSSDSMPYQLASAEPDEPGLPHAVTWSPTCSGNSAHEVGRSAASVFDVLYMMPKTRNVVGYEYRAGSCSPSMMSSTFGMSNCFTTPSSVHVMKPLGSDSDTTSAGTLPASR